MERITNSTLMAILRDELSAYAGPIETPYGDSRFYFTENLAEQIFCLTMPHISAELPATLLVMAHIAEDRIIIDLDNTGKPLADALRQAGVPNGQISLAWQDVG